MTDVAQCNCLAPEWVPYPVGDFIGALVECERMATQEDMLCDVCRANPRCAPRVNE